MAENDKKDQLGKKDQLSKLMKRLDKLDREIAKLKAKLGSGTGKKKTGRSR